jgi:uncharacterized protein (TIGR03437 family)
MAGGAAPQAQTFTITNAGGGSLNWSAQTSTTAGGNWLNVTPASGALASGQARTPVSVSANIAGLAAGRYYGTVNITAANTVNSPQTVSVVLNVLPALPSASVSVSTGGVMLTGAAGSSTGAQQSVSLFNLSSSAITYSATAYTENGTNWLSANPLSGSANPGANSIQIAANFSGLSAGLQFGSVTLAFGDGSTANIQVLALITGTGVSGANVVRSAGVAGARPMTIVSACPGGKASLLIPIFQQPAVQSTVQVTSAATVQVEVVDDCGKAVTAANGGAVQVTFNNGDPGIDLTDTGSGVWEATWTPQNAAAQVVLQVAATENGLTTNPSANVAGSETVVVQAASGGAAPQTTGIANAASAGQATPQVVAPGSYIAIYGTGLAGNGNSSATPGQPLPTTLNGTQILLGGLPLPLLYASSGQVNAVVPQAIGPNASYPLVVINGTTESVPVPMTVTELQPGTYTVNTSGSGAGIVANLAGQLITSSNPAHASDYLVIYTTGLGPLIGTGGQAEPADGAAAPSNITYQTTSTVTATIGGVPATVLFSGLTATLTALYQVNVQVPAGVTPGSAVPVVITATDPATGAVAVSNVTTIAVQ